MENIDYNNCFDLYFSDSDIESADEIKNFPILNFNDNTYQNVKNQILQLNSNDDKDYDLNNEMEENILLDELDEGIDEVLSDNPIKNNKYTPYKKNLYQQIQRSQDKIERLLILDKFIDQIINIDDYVTPDQHEQLWTLSEQIYNTFQDPDPNNHSLFEYTTQNTTEGYFKIETCYQHRVEYMQNLLAEEVYLTKKKNPKKEQLNT
ncbi:13024_t:CDS:2 [Cetraspora pellucida]|uniref:13024_t:CDS:1 n=1 Tax=Cetraspora pellucida TaxID=1433469 RepID=A0A9N9ICQ5_9GLOM|nr:13024_t:CDS:2 [Cetraspora pellucida]